MNIILTALSAKNIHKTLAPWCLKAYLDTHMPGVSVEVQEHTVNNHVGDIVAELFQAAPDVVGFSCYIWNIEHTVKVATMLKKLLPTCKIILGGPEVSFEPDCGAYPFAHAIVQGAGEVAFAELIQGLIADEVPHGTLISSGSAMRLDELPSPYTEAYFDSFAAGCMVSIKNQLVYYESSRGCPFSCSYCLSSALCGIQELSLERVFADIKRLLDHGATCIKFVDRTFNANKYRAMEILRHIFSLETACTFHFEVAADLFDEETLQLISAMPPERVQFEIGIQSVHTATLDEINRSTNTTEALRNIQTLAGFGNCHVHVDLIAGLPFETPETFAAGIDACLQTKPHMLQLGFLKLLKGTEIREKREQYDYVSSDTPPYEVYRSNTMSFADIIRLHKIEAVIDKYYNSGAFAHTVGYAMEQVFGSPYQFFATLADFCAGENLRVAPKRAYTTLFDFLCVHMERALAAHLIKLDCLTFSTKNVLPDRVLEQRDKVAENELRRSSAYRNIRIEHFAHDNKTRLFIYDERDAITGAHRVLELS
ncbi:MAG: DUF4080 domain-containing protein [Oscillospiraceae bacterium]|nr:DUF4080 domain-containing protein [Oscillospiraceae bacterium]